jgi:hypothetical protein
MNNYKKNVESESVSIGFLITAYHKKNQLVRLINMLGHKFGYENIFMHIDKRSSISIEEILSDTNSSVRILKNKIIYWGGFNQLESIVNLIKEATCKKKYDFLVLLSGQDLPIKSSNFIKEFLLKNKGKSFIEFFPLPSPQWNYKGGMGRIEWFWFMDSPSKIRGVYRIQKFLHVIFDKFNVRRYVPDKYKIFGGSDWWILDGNTALYCQTEFELNKKYKKIFNYSFIPSEMYFQTTIMNSEYRHSVIGNSLRFINWNEMNSGHPEVLTFDDLEKIKNENFLFARKFDLDQDPTLFNYYENKFLS